MKVELESKTPIEKTARGLVMAVSRGLGCAVWCIGKEEANEVLRGDGLERATARCRQEDGASTRCRSSKEYKQRIGRRHHGHWRQRRCVMARGRGRLTKQQRATSGMGSALVCTHGVEHGRRGKAAMKERGAWQSRPSMAVQGRRGPCPRAERVR